MITLSIDEKDPHVLRVSASYLLALASTPQVTAEIANNVASIHNTLVDNIAPTFNPAELVEAETLAIATPPADIQPTAAAVFGAGKSVNFTAGVDPSQTAPVDTTATTLIPTPPSVPLPPVVHTESAASLAVLPTIPPAASVEVDARGLPWDARIHSREKTKISNGNWKNKRGVEPDMLAAIEAELSKIMAIPEPPPLAPAAPVTPPPAIVPPPSAVTPTATPASLSSGTFPALMQKLTSAIAAKTLTNDQALVIAKQHGFESLPGLISRPDLIPQVEAAIDARISANIAGGA